MAIRIDLQQARQRLQEAIEKAQSQAELPDEWLQRARRLGDMPGKTATVALGTLLLARAITSATDAMAIKAELSGPGGYSARTLAHCVLVPAAVHHRFDLRASGREPLNNQPFFRYNRLDQIERTRNPETIAYLVECAERANDLDRDHALDALAAFLWVRFDAARNVMRVDLRGAALSAAQLTTAARTFLGEQGDGGRRAQAFAAAVFDLNYGDVRTSRVNDPSRHYPGDVQAMDGVRAYVAAEVRAKPVTAGEVTQFVQTLPDAGVAHGFVIVIGAPNHEPLNRETLVRQAWDAFGVYLSIVEGVDELLTTALDWVPHPIEDALQALADRVARRLEDLDAPPETHARWAELCQ